MYVSPKSWDSGRSLRGIDSVYNRITKNGISVKTDFNYIEIGKEKKINGPYTKR